LPTSEVLLVGGATSVVVRVFCLAVWEPNCIGLCGASRGGAWCDTGVVGGHGGSLELPFILI